MEITFNIIYLILFFILALIVYKYLEKYFVFKIYKPHLWEEAIKQNRIPNDLKKLERAYPDKIRLYNLWFQINRINRENIQGDMAELGVHKGETALLLYKMSNNQKLHLFDTFEGFSENDLQHENKQGGQYTTNEFSDTDVETVKKRFNGDSRVIIQKGYFPDTAKGLEQTQFSFVHLDADLYMPTLEGLKFFYPRLANGGVIVIHDYNHIWSGVKKAVDEFMPTIPETLIELPDWKGSVMIVKTRI